MPTLDIKNWDNKTVGSVDLPEEIYAYPYKEHLVHAAVRNHLAAVRSGTHKTKVRSEVSGSGKKPFRQKGTGRARQGGGRPGIHRHGGTIFGPVPRDYSYKMNVREKKGALKSAISWKLREGQIVLLEDLGLEAPRTRGLVDGCSRIGIEGKALFIDSLDNVNLVLASRNHPRMQVVDALGVNVYDVVNARWLVISRGALDRLTEALGK